MSESVQKSRIRLKKRAIEYKGGCCIKCGYKKCIAALEFHHVDPNEKEFTFGMCGKIRSWEKIKIELDKCILVCANCHRETHSELIYGDEEFDVTILNVRKTAGIDKFLPTSFTVIA